MYRGNIDLDALTEDDWEELFAINEEQAMNSDAGGDSDADDAHDVTYNTEASGPSTRSVSSCKDTQTAYYEPTAQDVPPITNSNLDSAEDNKRLLTKWSNKRFQTPSEYKNTAFHRYTGINAEVDLSSPLNVLSLFFTSSFFNLMVTESNKYATQTGQSLNLCEDELKKFIGVFIIMGFHSLPSMRLYWSQDLNFHVERISRVMSMRRFLKILRLLYVSDNANMVSRGQPGFDRLFKIHPLLTHFSAVFRSAFSPHRQLSIDESMIAFKGRSTLKQYMPLKPIKCGFKVWVICCAVTGYMIGFEIYEGKSLTGGREISLGESVVMKLAAMFEGFGYCLFFDRFFTALPLLIKLLKNKIFAVGTIMPSRKYFPTDKLPLDRTMAMSESACAMTKSNISVTKWRDRGKKVVCVASNMHNPNIKGYVRRTNSRGEKERVSCPKPIIDYNKYMGGVDKFDQLMSSYSIAWKSRRWWMKIWFYLIDAAIVNSYIIYKDTWIKAHPGGNKPMTHLQFRSKLADELIGKVETTLPVFQTEEGGDHKLIKSVKKYLRRCRYCSTTAKPKRSVYECISCNVALCVECFVPFHESGKEKKAK